MKLTIFGASGRTGVHLAEWDLVADARPEIHVFDGVHLTDGGQDIYAALVAGTVDGILLDRVKFFWGADYGHLSFTSDHSLVQNCESIGLSRTKSRVPSRIWLTTAEALNESPADPVINSFHLTALAQRNAMLREIAREFATSPFIRHPRLRPARRT